MTDTQRLVAALLALAPDNTSGLISPQDLRDMLVSAVPANVYNAQHYIGGPPDGSTDNTTALDQMFTDYKANNYKGLLYFPPSDSNYMYSGDGWDGVTYNIAGAGRNASIVQLGTGKYLLACSTALSNGHMRDIQIQNGAGCYKQSFTGASSVRGFLFENVWFKGYSTCAVGSLASDDPYMRFFNCIFDGTADQSFGIALPSDISGGWAYGCSFIRNRYHMKLGWGGVEFKIRDCSFIRSNAYVATSRVDIWLVPRSSATDAGNGCVITGCKFGNEQIGSGDYKILLADEDTTVTDFTDTPHSSSTSSNFIRGVMVDHNRSSGSSGASPSLIYSTVDDVDGLLIGPNHFDGTAPSYVLEFLNSGAKTTTKTWFTGNAHVSSGLLTFSNRSITSL